MTSRSIEALHDVHTATNDVLKGYREMLARAEPDVQAVMRRLTEMHERHAAAQSAELLRLHDTGKDDSSVQGTVNKVVVILRDWLSDIDRDALPAVRDGEESIRDEYTKALRDIELPLASSVSSLLKSQLEEINVEIARLPKD